jgi:chaperonin GroES
MSKNKFNIIEHDLVHDNVLVEPVEPKGDEDGLIDPNQYEDKSEWGKVLSVGPGRVLENGDRTPMSVEVGDLVTFGKFSPYVARVNGKDYLIIRDEDIMSKIK